MSAGEVLDKLHMVLPPFDPYEVARVLGVEVREFTTPRPWAGALDARNADAPVIWVKAADHPRRKQFTVAHEIGHLLLHRPSVIYRDNPEFLGGPEEREANRFAAELLMPEHAVRREVHRVGRPSPAAVAPRFKVSAEAMKYRLRNLGYPVSMVMPAFQHGATRRLREAGRSC